MFYIDYKLNTHSIQSITGQYLQYFLSLDVIIVIQCTSSQWQDSCDVSIYNWEGLASFWYDCATFMQIEISSNLTDWLPKIQIFLRGTIVRGEWYAHSEQITILCVSAGWLRLGMGQRYDKVTKKEKLDEIIIELPCILTAEQSCHLVISIFFELFGWGMTIWNCIASRWTLICYW